ncbi:MAG: hypothetical protein SGILL_007481, partial [Bacillariaceae sp.]
MAVHRSSVFCYALLALFSKRAVAFSSMSSKRAPARSCLQRTTPLYLAADVEENDGAPIPDRRLFLGSSLVGTAAAMFASSIKDSNQALLLTQRLVEDAGSIPTTATVASVEEAIRLIESSCDKRFLHAVVASDYQFLYENKQPQELPVDPTNLFAKANSVVDETSNQMFTMATTGDLASKRASSSWPLDTTSLNRIHYAWPQEGGRLGAADDQAII